jgi:hypothetical protein
MSHHRGRVAAARRQHQGRRKASRAPEATIHHAIHPDPLQGGRDNGNAETHRDEVEGRCEAQGLMAKPRVEACRVARRNLGGIRPRPLRAPSVNNVSPTRLSNGSAAAEAAWAALRRVRPKMTVASLDGLPFAKADDRNHVADGLRKGSLQDR